jgi:photosystem II stability/assembly factor-like uncharacterized protein
MKRAKPTTHLSVHGTILLSAFLLVATAVATDWQELGPAPVVDGPYTGRVSAIACHPVDPNRYYVAGADGGVWRTTDGGTTWTPLTNDMPTTAMGALALDPTNPNIIYAGTGEANYANHSRYGVGLYKSTDGGNSWMQFAATTFGGRTFSKIVINPQNPQRLYAAVARAGGFPGGTLPAAKGHPDRNGPVGIFRSDDGGDTWTQLLTGLPNQAATDVALHSTDPNILYAAIGHPFGATENGIYKTTNGGDSWTKLAGGLPTASVGRISLALAPSQPARVYTLITHTSDSAGGGASTLGGYRTDNNGTTWTALGSLSGLQSSYGWFLSVVSVKPNDPNTVIMGGLDLVRSTNAGASWTYITPPHVDMHALAWDASGRLVCGDDGGVHRSPNVGTSWTSHNSFGIIQFYAGLSTHPSNVNYMIGGFQDNGSNRRSDLTKNWTQLFGGDGGWTQIDQVSPLRMFVEYQGTGNLYLSTNGGSIFNYAGSGINSGDRNCFLPPYLIDPTNSNKVLYATHRVYRSTNGGTSWTAVSPDLTGGGIAAIRALAQSPSDPNFVYAATNDGRIQRSTNGGTSFTLVATGIPGWPRVTRELFVDPTSPLTVYLAVANFGQSQIQRSLDGGQTWTPLDATFPDIPVNVVAADARGVWPVIYAGADDGLYRSIDDGATWHRYGHGLPNAPVIDLRLEAQAPRRRLIACTQGRGAWSIAVCIPGDMNDDEIVDFDDISAFVLGLSDPAAYHQLYPQLDPGLSGDTNGDGLLDFDDINGFVALLSG